MRRCAMDDKFVLREQQELLALSFIEEYLRRDGIYERVLAACFRR